jgi:hypothetical protein
MSAQKLKRKKTNICILHVCFEKKIRKDPLIHLPQGIYCHAYQDQALKIVTTLKILAVSLSHEDKKLTLFPAI